jgi:signal transduction histidine kinase/ActR/RegA family two-component response regulator
MGGQTAETIWNAAEFCSADAASPLTLASTAPWLSFLDYFTNFGQYMDRTHCMVTATGESDWFWIFLIVGLTLGVVGAYLKIFIFWRRCYLSEEKADRNHKLMELAWVFAWCAVCGYAIQLLMFVWPAYRLIAVFLVVLNISAWRFIANPAGIRTSLAANRYRRELAESLTNRNAELERLVESRTAELEVARQKAEEADRVKSGFLANMSHEIRTPMAAILGYTDLLGQVHRGEADGVDATETLETIKRNGDHLLNVINDILDLSKIEAERLEIERVPCSPVELLLDVVELLSHKVQDQHVVMDVEIEAAQGCILSDPTRLRQIFINIIGNAIKFAPGGTVSISASRVELEAGPGLVVKVADSGIGMTEQQLDALFVPFTQADSSTSRKFGGTGLGLSIAQRLATALGGGIVAESQPGKGSVFTVTVAAEPAAVPVRTAEHKAFHIDASLSTKATVPLTGMRVLLTDDCADNRRLFAMQLRRAGALVTMCENGQQAVDRCSEAVGTHKPYHIVLMDVQMPVLNGLEATRLVRAMGISTPIVALTANAMREDEIRCIEAGCNAFVTKPIRREQLIQVCTQWAGGSASQAA